MGRVDVSYNLIHLTKDSNDKDAYSNLMNIIDGRIIKASNRCVKGEHYCVCFSEAPIDCLDAKFCSRYSQFGLMFSKKHIYRIGGRPVIYQHDNEYNTLPESLRWRHVRYNPCGEGEDYNDWTWEREWRVPSDVVFSSDDVHIIVPDREWVEKFLSDYKTDLEYQFLQYRELFDETYAMQMVTPDTWKFVMLE